MSELKPFTGTLDSPGGLKPFEGIVDEEKASVPRRYFADPAVSAAKGIVGLGEAALGLADMPTLGYAGKLAEQVGIRPKEWQQSLESLYSQEQKAANQAVQEAQGFVPTAKAMLENPSTLAHGIIENVPSMVGGGLIARGLVKAAPKVISTLTGAAIGEGVVTAGQNTEQVRQAATSGLLTPEQIGLMAVSGALTGGIGRVSGGIAKKFGFQNLEEMIAGGRLEAGAPVRGPIARAVGGFITEGALEELPQSAQEQVAINLAQGKPWDDGVGSAAAQGLLIGGLMGAGGNVLFGQRLADGAMVPPGQPVPPGLQPPPQGFPPPSGGAAPASTVPTLTDAAATAVATGAVAEARAGREQEAAAAQQPPEGAPPAAPTGGETPKGPISGAITPAEKPVTIEEATKLKEEREAATGLVQNITPSPIQSDKFDVRPTNVPAPPDAKAQQAATKEAEAAQKVAWAGLDKRVSTFKDEARDLEQKAKATKGEGEPQLPPMFKALTVVSNPVFDPKAATKAIKTAIDGKRPDVAIAIVERAERAAIEAAAAKPSVPETNGMYVPIQKMLQKKAEAARKTADKLAAAAGLQPGVGNAIQKPSAAGVLPRQPEGTGIQGGERGRVGPSVKGQEAPGQGAAPVVGPGQDVQGDTANVPGQAAAGQGQVARLSTPAVAVTAPPGEPEPNPTPGQIEAGNYKKGHVTAAGHQISIENKEGMVRKSAPGVTPAWEREIKQADYGYIKRTEGNDGDQVDAFVKPGTTPEHDGPVWVIDQLNKNGKFDEHKAMIGYASQLEAVAAYKANYPSGWKVGPVTEATNEQFKEWLKSGDMTKGFAERAADPLDKPVEYDVQEVDDAGKPTGRTVLAKVPARQALADIDERHEFAKALLDCLRT